MSSIARQVIALRKAAGMSQADLAAASGVSRQLISQIERGENLSTTRLPALASALDCLVVDLDNRFGQTGVLSSDPTTLKLLNLIGLLAAEDRELLLAAAQGLLARRSQELK